MDPASSQWKFWIPKGPMDPASSQWKFWIKITPNHAYLRKRVEKSVPFQNRWYFTDVPFTCLRKTTKIEKKNTFPKKLFQTNLAQSSRPSIETHKTKF